MQQVMLSPSSTNCTAASMGLISCVYSQMWKNVPDLLAFDAEELVPLFALEHDSTVADFNELVREWKSNRSTTSLVSVLAMHPAYQRIIGLGKRALPLILRELEREPDHWFWALKAISGEDPVPPESRGNIREMIVAWLRWGRGKGYVR